MHVSGDTSERRPRRAAFVLAALSVLLALVAVASSGHVPGGTQHHRRPAYEVLDTLVSLLLVLMLVGAGAILLAYYLRRTAWHEAKRQGLARPRWPTMLAVVGVALLVGLALHAVWQRGQDRATPLARPALPQTRRAHENTYTPHFATIPVAVILGAAAIAALAGYVSMRARRSALQRHGSKPLLTLALADVLGETLDDLRAEPDPRVAVIAAYARLERTLTAFGLPRRDADAPAEYLRRILVELEVGAEPASRLTRLFEQAKFSPHDVGQELKEEAIDLLETIRTDLRATEEARLAARPANQAVERPA
jgi:hypothetical protein